MPKINIYQLIYGSLSNPLGDSTLAYSIGTSNRANDVRGLFMDDFSMPRLSSAYSSLVWRYYAQEDRYIAIHVQGSQITDPSMGRYYSYRAAFEVNRDELNKELDFDLYSLISSLPRVKMYTRIEKRENLQDIPILPMQVTSEARALALLIRYAILNKKQLCLSLDITGRNLVNNGTLDSPELKTLVTAINTLPLGIRRYATFGFLIDQNYLKVLDDVLILVYPRNNSSFQVPKNSIDIRWEDIAKEAPAPWNIQTEMKFEQLFEILPGEREPLLGMMSMMKKLDTYQGLFDSIKIKDPLDFSSDEFKLWFNLGHKVSEIHVDNWAEAYKVVSLIDETHANEFIQDCKLHTNAFGLAGMNHDIFKKFNIDGKELQALQAMAFNPYMLEGEYLYLFPGGIVPENLLNRIDGNWVLKQATEPKKTQRIYSICERYGRLKDKNVIASFEKLAKDLLPNNLEGLINLLYKFRKNEEKEPSAMEQLMLEQVREENYTTFLKTLNDYDGAYALFELRNEKLTKEAKNHLEYVVYPALTDYATKIGQQCGTDVKRWNNFLMQKESPLKEFILDLLKEWNSKDLCALAENLIKEKGYNKKMAQTLLSTLEYQEENNFKDKKVRKAMIKKLSSEAEARKSKMDKFLGKLKMKKVYRYITLICCTLILVSLAVIAAIFGFGKKETTPEPAKPMAGITIGHATDMNTMLQLGQLAKMQSEVQTVALEDTVFDNIDLKKLATLKSVNTAYYKTHSTDEIEVIMEQDKEKPDTMIINSQNTILDVLLNHPVKIEKILDGKNTGYDIPNQIFEKLEAKDESSYYFWVIQEIEDHFVKDKKQHLKVAY